MISERLVALAAHYRIPALYEWREFVTAGGLMSYSTDRNEVGREAGAGGEGSDRNYSHCV